MQGTDWVNQIEPTDGEEISTTITMIARVAQMGMRMTWVKLELG